MEHILHAVEQHVITLHRQEKNHKQNPDKSCKNKIQPFFLSKCANKSE